MSPLLAGMLRRRERIEQTRQLIADMKRMTFKSDDMLDALRYSLTPLRRYTHGQLEQLYGKRADHIIFDEISNMQDTQYNRGVRALRNISASSSPNNWRAAEMLKAGPFIVEDFIRRALRSKIRVPFLDEMRVEYAKLRMKE